MRPQTAGATRSKPMKTLHHYVIVRGDIPEGHKFAQAIHAAAESCEGPLPSGTYAYGLEARDEDHLLEKARLLWDNEVPHTVIHEPDPPYDGEAMAIGVWPTADKERLRRFLSDLPLLGRRK